MIPRNKGSENMRDLVNYWYAMFGMMKKYCKIENKGDECKNVCKNSLSYTSISKIKDSGIKVILHRIIFGKNPQLLRHF